MRDSIKKAIGGTVQGLINSGLKTSFTEKELNSLGVTIPEVKFATYQINRNEWVLGMLCEGELLF